MTAAELIAKLQRLEPTAEVRLVGDDIVPPAIEIWLPGHGWVQVIR